MGENGQVSKLLSHFKEGNNEGGGGRRKNKENGQVSKLPSFFKEGEGVKNKQALFKVLSTLFEIINATFKSLEAKRLLY